MLSYSQKRFLYSKMKSMENIKDIKVLIVDKEDVSKTLMANYLKDIDSIQEIQKFSTLDEAYKNILSDTSYVIIVDISDNTKELLNLVNKISLENKCCKLILVSYHVSANFVVDALRSGAKEFLGKPIIKEDLIAVFEKVVSQFGCNQAVEDRSMVISTFSNKGGLGKTTVAVNLAKELADVTKEKVVLVDLNMHLGDVTAFLDINPNYDTKYIIDNLDKADDEFLFATLEQYKSSNFYILADSPYREPTDEINTQDIIRLLKALRKTFSYIVLDNSSTIDNKIKSVCDESDLILFVTTANLPTLRNCQRCLTLFDKFGYTDDKLKIVLNRYISNEEYKIEDVEAALDKKIFWKIPNNYFTVIEAINKGITLNELNSKSNVTENYRLLAQEIANRV